MASSGTDGWSISRVRRSGSSWTRATSACCGGRSGAPPLIDPILDHFKHGRENLDIILWAMKLGLPMAEVREILEALDVNSRRIECRFDPRRRVMSH